MVLCCLILPACHTTQEILPKQEKVVSKSWNTDTYKKLTPIVLKMWSYSDYQKLIGISKVPINLQQCYLSDKAKEVAFQTQLEHLEFLYDKYPQQEIDWFLNEIPDDLINYYYYVGLYNLSDKFSDKLDDKATSVIEQMLENASYDESKVRQLMSDKRFMQFRTLFGLGTQGMTMSKSQYSLLDAEVMDYCNNKID